MAERHSLADRAVHALALVAAMDAEVTSDSPERHIVWDLKNQAEEVLSDGFNRAMRLAHTARSATREMNCAIEAVAPKRSADGG